MVPSGSLTPEPHLLGHLRAVGEPLCVCPGLHDLEKRVDFMVRKAMISWEKHGKNMGKTWESTGDIMGVEWE